MMFDKLIFLLKPLVVIVILIYIMVLIKLYFMNRKFKNINYFDVSGDTFLRTVNSKWKRRVFATYLIFKKLPGDNKILFNLYLPREDGETSKIDLMMINKTGIYVFDLKSTKGHIYGNEKNRVWKQVFFGFVETTFPNPIWHSMGQISALMHILENVDKGDVYSFIVFGRRSKLKKIKHSIRHLYVIESKHLLQRLKKDFEKRSDIFNESQINEIFTFLSKYANADEEARKRHVEELRQKNSKAENPEVED